jgi:hypothetical protein
LKSRSNSVQCQILKIKPDFQCFGCVACHGFRVKIPFNLNCCVPTLIVGSNLTRRYYMSLIFHPKQITTWQHIHVNINVSAAKSLTQRHFTRLGYYVAKNKFHSNYKIVSDFWTLLALTWICCRWFNHICQHLLGCPAYGLHLGIKSFHLYHQKSKKFFWFLLTWDRDIHSLDNFL